jgi:uncharacterized membrane protein
MRYTFGMLIGVICLVLGIMSVRILLDRDHPRPQWAKACIGLLAVSAFIAAILTGLVVSGRAGLYMRPEGARGMATFFRALTIGLFVVLSSSRQWSLKGPPK